MKTKKKTYTQKRVLNLVEKVEKKNLFLKKKPHSNEVLKQRKKLRPRQKHKVTKKKKQKKKKHNYIYIDGKKEGRKKM